MNWSFGLVKYDLINVVFGYWVVIVEDYVMVCYLIVIFGYFFVLIFDLGDYEKSGD